MASDLSWNLHGNDQLSGVLEKLEKTLGGLSRKLDGATRDAREMGTALGNVEGKAKSFGNQTAAAGGHLDRFSEKASSAIGMLGRFGAAAVVALGAATVMGAGFALKIAAANESAAISFEVLFGSAEKAQRFLAKLKKFAADTPFAMPELREAASRLLAVGVNADRIIPLLTRLGDATSAMGTGAFGIQRAVYALQQMSQAGKVSLEDINQLTDAGIPALDALSAKLGVTVAKLREDISKGKIKPEQLFDAILSGAGKTFPKLNGMMQRQATTLTGMWSTFKDNAGEALAKFAEPAIPGIKKVLDFTSTNLPKALDAIMAGGKRIGSIFKGSDVPAKLLSSLRSLGDKVLPALKAAWDGIVKTVEDNREGLEKLGRFCSDILIPLFGDALVISITNVGMALQAIVWVAARVVDAVTLLTQVFLTNMRLILTGAVATFGWIPGLGPKLKTALKDFDRFAAGVMNKLNSLDGRTVRINLKFVEDAQAWTAQRNKERQGRASGGPVWAGETYNWNEMGPERFYAAATGVIQTNEQVRAMSGGGDDGVIGVVKLQLTGEDGRVTHEKLLKFKRDSGRITLGLA